MPTPVSATRSVANAASCATAMRMTPPSGVYFNALSTRLVTICSRRVASPSTQTGSVAAATS